jgi:hypothetical protein
MFPSLQEEQERRDQHHPAPTLRATIALCFLLGEIFSLAVLAMKGRLGLAECSTYGSSGAGASPKLPPVQSASH